MNIKDYLNKHTIFKRSEIVKETDFDNGAMSKWLSSHQGIPDHRLEEIRQYMIKYGIYHEEMVDTLIRAKEMIEGEFGNSPEWLEEMLKKIGAEDEL